MFFQGQKSTFNFSTFQLLLGSDIQLGINIFTANSSQSSGGRAGVRELHEI